jgi:hypothetical protein
MSTHLTNLNSTNQSNLSNITAQKSIAERLEEIERKMNDIAWQIGTMAEGEEYQYCFKVIGELHHEKARLLCEARNTFMEIFRLDTFGDIISADDAHEVFAGVLHGSSDVTKELLDEVLDNYNVGNIDIVENQE